MIAINNSTATTDGVMLVDWISYRTYSIPEKIEEDNLWMLQDYKEWKKRLKSLWFAVLREKPQDLGQQVECKLYHRRILTSVSGWLARAGYRKKKN